MKQYKLDGKVIQSGRKVLAYDPNHTGEGERQRCWMQPIVWTKGDAAVEKYGITIEEVTVQPDPATIAKQLSDAIYAEYEMLLSDSLESVGITRSPEKVLAEQTARFAALSAKDQNGGRSASEQVEWEAIKTFNEHWTDPLLEERNRLLGALIKGSPSESDYPEWTDELRTELESIVAIQLKLV